MIMTIIIISMSMIMIMIIVIIIVVTTKQAAYFGRLGGTLSNSAKIVVITCPTRPVD